MKERYREEEIPKIATAILADLRSSDTATILALQGDLGAGKTTLTKAVAAELGVQESVQSPTFVIAKFYDANNTFETLIHIDAYRIENPEELITLGWADMLLNSKTLIVIEWPEKIEALLPANTNRYVLRHEENERTIETYER